MLQTIDPADIDFNKFYTPGEGFSSWYFKIVLWLGDERRFLLPEIKVQKTNAGKLSLKDRNIVTYISEQTEIDPSQIADMLDVDIEGLRASASFMFANEFSPPETINIRQKPKQFCPTCFSNSLLNKTIPIFDPYWTSQWATHCILHQTPLASIKFLDSYDYNAVGFYHDDGSQYTNWCNRIVGFTRALRGQYSARPNSLSSPASNSTIAINQLFNSKREAKKAVSYFGLKMTPEAVRQKLLTAFYLLSKRFKTWSIGRDMTYNRHGFACFPTTDFFSSRILEILEGDQLVQCLEYLAQFIGLKDNVYPYLLIQAMREARVEFSKHSVDNCSEIESEPMVYLSWLIWYHFEKSYSEDIAGLFPLYAEEWTNKFEKISCHFPGKL